MGLTHKIFQRATIRGIADYLLFGQTADEDSRSYEERLKGVDLEFEKAVSGYDEDEHSKLLELANTMICEVAAVYTEIGLQAGLLLMKDMIQNVEIDHQEDKVDYQEKYESLLQKVMAVSDILEASDDESAKKAKDILQSVK